MDTYLKSPDLLIVIALANVPIVLLVLRFAFDSWADLGEALLFWLGPVWLQIADVMFRGGDWSEHQWESLKVVVVVLVVGGMVLSEYAYIVSHFPRAVAWAHGLLSLGHRS